MSRPTPEQLLAIAKSFGIRNSAYCAQLMELGLDYGEELIAEAVAAVRDTLPVDHSDLDDVITAIRSVLP